MPASEVEQILAILRARFPWFSEVLAGIRPTILYPAARMARSGAAHLRSSGVRVIGFGDGNASLWGSVVDGLPVWSPGEIARDHGDAAVLVSSSIHDSAICETLDRQGCNWVIPMPVLNYLLPEYFPCREYTGALEAVISPECRVRIEMAAEIFADDASRLVFLEKIRYLQTLEKGRLDAIRCSQPIYFDPEVICLIPDEVFVDGGAFDGDTFSQFLHAGRGRFKTYYAFEPDPGNFARLQQRTSEYRERVVVLPAGLADHTGHLTFECGASYDSHMTTASAQSPTATTVQVHGLDDFFVNLAPPSFIKLDIEGAESQALNGAKRLITDQQPILAISVYHNPCDLWELPLLIHELNPRYSLFLRHYTREIDDTVCYAVPPGRQASS